MKFLTLVLALVSTSPAFAGGGGTVSTECRSQDQKQFLGFEQNIAWFRKGEQLESSYDLTVPSGATVTGSEVVQITENSATNFNVSGRHIKAIIEFVTGDFGPANVTVQLGHNVIHFSGTCDVK